jgi:hypothetical protein
MKFWNWTVIYKSQMVDNISSYNTWAHRDFRDVWLRRSSRDWVAPFCWVSYWFDYRFMILGRRLQRREPKCQSKWEGFLCCGSPPEDVKATTMKGSRWLSRPDLHGLWYRYSLDPCTGTRQIGGWSWDSLVSLSFSLQCRSEWLMEARLMKPQLVCLIRRSWRIPFFTASHWWEKLLYVNNRGTWQRRGSLWRLHHIHSKWTFRFTHHGLDFGQPALPIVSGPK